MITGTKEWAEHSANICRGCSHDCLYCYAKEMAIRFGRATADDWHEEHMLPAKRFGKRSGRIMFPTTHDITPGTIDASIVALKQILAAGNEVLIVSKPHLECIEQLCEQLTPWRRQIMFRFTIGSLNDVDLRFWEPGAPSVEDRFRSLQWAYAAGYHTSVSCEPLLCSNPAPLVRELAPYVTDSIWIGKANKLVQRMTRNGCTPEQIAVGKALADSQNNTRIRWIYRQLKEHPLVRWKESIKAVVGLELVTEARADR